MEVEYRGIGHFADHVIAVGERLDPFVPTLLGMYDGLVFFGLEPVTEDAVLTTYSYQQSVTDYVLAHSKRLVVSADRSTAPEVQLPAHEIVAQIFSKALWGNRLQLFGGMLLRPLFAALLKPNNPVLTDGMMFKEHWSTSGNSLVKSHFAESSGNHFDLAYYDPIFDLAQAASELDSPQADGRQSCGKSSILSVMTTQFDLSGSATIRT